MLKENKTVRQREKEGFRRWFVNNYFDIIIWYENKYSKLKGFQVCYSKNKHEKAFTWEPSFASSHYVSDSMFEKGMSSFATAILIGHAGKIPDIVINRLIKEQGELDNDILDFIVDKIKEYNKRF